MKLKHTPGPWTVMPGKGQPRVCVEGDREWPIVVVSSGHSESATFANEMLIAAAPELLAALKMSLELIRDGYIDFSEYGFKTDHEIEIFIEKIIAKAEGK